MGLNEGYAMRLARLEQARMKARLELRIKANIQWELAVKQKRYSYKFN